MSFAENPCPRCGKSRGAIESQCECGWTPPPVWEAIPQPSPGATLRAATTYRLDSLLLSMTLIAVCLGVGMFVPALGIFLTLLAVPAWVRVTHIRLRRKVAGQPMTVGDKVLAFLASLTVVFSILFATCMACLIACGYISAGVVYMRESAWGVLFFVVGALAVGCMIPVVVILARSLWRGVD